MAEETGGQEKTEEPTARRLEEARRKGDVAKSIEVSSAAVLLAGLLTLYGMSGFYMEHFYRTLRHYLGNLHSIRVVPDQIPALTLEGMKIALLTVGPLMVVVLVMAIGGNVLQFGFLFTTEKLAPKFEKISPVEGVKRMFSLQMLANTIKSVVKVILVGLVAYLEIKKNLPALAPLMGQDVRQIVAFIAYESFWIVLKCAAVIAILALADYAFQRWDFRKKMRMTKQELKDEAKQTEGDPHVKGRIRSIQMEIARRRMMEEVPKADVVITNPTRLAVALRYEATVMSAPQVVAKGAGVVAHRIKEVAREHGVPVVENRDLARALYAQVQIGKTIPENLFQAVAEVLAYVYSLRSGTAAA